MQKRLQNILEFDMYTTELEFFISVAANDQDINDNVFLKKLKAKLSGSADVIG